MFRPKDREKCQQLYEKYYAGRKFHDALYRDLKFSKEWAGYAEVVGIDLESTLETSNQGSPYGVRGDLNYLPFPSGYFDLIISRHVVEHLEEPPRVFREFQRVLKPGGKVILLTPNK